MTAQPSWSTTRDVSILATLGLGSLIAWTTAPRLMLFAVAVAAVTLAGCVLRAARDPAYSPTRALHNVAKAVAVTWGLGLVAAWLFASPPVLLSVVLALVALGWTGAWLVQNRPQPTALEEAAVSNDDAELERAVETATDEQLRDLWQRSASVLRHAYLPSSVNRYTEIRRLVLDEAERRAPDRVAQWLAEDPRTDNLPAYLRKT